MEIIIGGAKTKGYAKQKLINERMREKMDDWKLFCAAPMNELSVMVPIFHGITTFNSLNLS